MCDLAPTNIRKLLTIMKLVPFWVATLHQATSVYLSFCFCDFYNLFSVIRRLLQSFGELKFFIKKIQ